MITTKFTTLEEMTEHIAKALAEKRDEFVHDFLVSGAMPLELHMEISPIQVEMRGFTVYFLEELRMV